MIMKLTAIAVRFVAANFMINEVEGDLLVAANVGQRIDVGGVGVKRVPTAAARASASVSFHTAR
ncbi:hypothetical protein [Micromonospora sp. DT227]|uniref:hypothetical protein n=1 Tax=Micromonospora sp. DT227 TaxID=3393433 RepID=UPI003CEDB085